MDATGQELNDLLNSTFNLIIQVEQEVFRGTRFNDLSVAEIHTIDAIGTSQRSMGEVAADLDITLATLNASVGRLCAKGYAERRRTEEDRRLVLLHLTRSGQIVARLHSQFHLRMMAQTMGSLTQEELEVLKLALRKIRKCFASASGDGLQEEENV